MREYKINREIEVSTMRERYIGKTFPTKKYGNLKVLGCYERDVNYQMKFVVEFEDSSFQTLAYICKVLEGEVKDYTRSLCGIGNTVDFQGERFFSTHPMYKHWAGMINRCYGDKNSKSYREMGEVSKRWLTFSNFIEDSTELLGYSEMMEYPEIKWAIDKDLIKYNNQTYSFEKCCFLPEEINRFIGKAKHETDKDRKYNFIGVFSSGTGRFRGEVKNHKGVRIGIPTSDNPYEVHSIYWNTKIKVVSEVIENEYGFLSNEIKQLIYKRFNYRWKLSLKELQRADIDGQLDKMRQNLRTGK